jgi:hypothetical protein
MTDRRPPEEHCATSWRGARLLLVAGAPVRRRDPSPGLVAAPCAGRAGSRAPPASRLAQGAPASRLSPRARGTPAEAREARQRPGSVPAPGGRLHETVAGADGISEPELCEPGMVRRSRALGPAKLPVLLADRHVVDARLAPSHVALAGELPLLVAMGPEPVPGVVVVLVDEADRDPVLAEGPELLDEPVVDLPGPLATEEGDDLLAALEELGAVPPPAVRGVGAGDSLRVAGVLGVLGGADLRGRGLEAERRDRGTGRHRGTSG